MSMRKKVYYSVIGLTLIVLVNACIPAVNIKREQLSKSDITCGSVVVGTVFNKRAEDSGGKGFEFIGLLRGGYGNQFILKTEPGREIDLVIKEMAKAALEHTGYSTDQVAGKSLRLDIDLINVWCDGYFGYNIEANIAVKLVNPDDGNVLVQKNILAKNGFGIISDYSWMHKAFDDTINDIQKELIVFMKSQEFRKAAKL